MFVVFVLLQYVIFNSHTSSESDREANFLCLSNKLCNIKICSIKYWYNMINICLYILIYPLYYKDFWNRLFYIHLYTFIFTPDQLVAVMRFWRVSSSTGTAAFWNHVDFCCSLFSVLSGFIAFWILCLAPHSGYILNIVTKSIVIQYKIYLSEIYYRINLKRKTMAAPGQGEDSDDGMDEFMEKFKKEKYKNAFNESNWEEVRTVTLVKI